MELQRICSQVRTNLAGARIVIRPDSLNEQIGNIGEDVKYEMKEGEGSFFKNDKKSKETDADYNGSARLNGTDYTINGWKKQAKSGVSYLQLSLRPKGGATKKSVPFDDDLSF
jgi:hypothetical protein